MLERSDLYKIAQLLDKPIEYFYGENFRYEEFEDLLAIMRKQSPDARNSSIDLTKMIVKMQELVEGLESTSENEKVPTENIIEFYATFAPFSFVINTMAAKYNETREQIENGLKIRGIDLSNKS